MRPLPRKLACNSTGRNLNNARKRCNSNDQNSRFEIVSGELHAKLGAGSWMWEVTAGCESRGMEGPGRGAGGRRGLAGYQDNTSSHTPAHQAPLVWRAPEGPEGTGGLRDDAPSEARSADDSRAGCRPRRSTAPLVRRAPEGPEGTGGLRDRPLRAAGSRVAISRAAGPSGAQRASGATRHLGITKPPGPTGAGRLSKYQRLTAGPRRCRGLRGRSPGERWKYRAWRQRPSRSPPCGDPRRRRWRSAWPSRQHSRRRCPRSRPG